MHLLIQPSQLAKLLDRQDTLVFDCSWHMPASDRDAAQEFADGHIPGAQLFDFDKAICKPDTDLPHMLPGEQQCTRQLRQLGVHNNSLLVCYDSLGLFSAARVWWMLRTMGCARVAVLDGGLPAWQRQGFAIERGQAAPRQPGNFTARLQPGWLVDAAQVLKASQTGEQLILDARSPERFSAARPEPRPGLRSGHIPGSCNLFFGRLIEDGRLLPHQQLKQQFDALNPDGRELIASCGSGITACIVALAAHLAGHNRVAVYDGSWVEWGARADLPIEPESE